MTKTKSTIWDNIYLPILEDSASIQVAIHQITSAYLCSRLDARHTGLLLYAVQIASQNIDRKTFHSKSEIVRSMTVTDEGDELAPEKEICESSDCANCHRRDTCDKYYPDEEDCDSDEDEDDCDSDEEEGDPEEDDRDSDEEEGDPEEDDCDPDEEDEEPAVPSPAPSGIQRLQRAILARLDEGTILRLSAGDPDSGVRHAAEELVVLKGHDSSRAENAPKQERALAPEGSLSPIPPENPSLSATPGEIIIPVLANGEPLYPLRSAIRTG